MSNPNNHAHKKVRVYCMDCRTHLLTCTVEELYLRGAATNCPNGNCKNSLDYYSTTKFVAYEERATKKVIRALHRLWGDQ